MKLLWPDGLLVDVTAETGVRVEMWEDGNESTEAVVWTMRALDLAGVVLAEVREEILHPQHTQCEAFVERMAVKERLKAALLKVLAHAPR